MQDNNTENSEEVSIKKKLFGEEVEICIWDMDKSIALDLVEEAYSKGVKLSSILNFYDKKSELSMLNSKRSMKVSKELLELTKQALKFCELTSGAYDISLGKVFAARKKGKEEKASCSYKDIKIKDNLITLTNNDVMIDLGSIAKGYIVDKIADNLIENGVISGLVDGRGDMRVFGEREEIIGIQHPRDKGKIIASIKLSNMAVATSGDYNQYVGTFETSHIINPKDLISISVINKSASISDAFATLLFVCDKKTRESIIAKNKDIMVLTIDSNLKLKSYNGFEKIIIH
jgi:thiamine biosynthesis lipoprotein